MPERSLDAQFYGDVRNLEPRSLAGYNTVVQLAAISNDPMGDRYAVPTMDINQRSQGRSPMPICLNVMPA